MRKSAFWICVLVCVAALTPGVGALDQARAADCRPYLLLGSRGSGETELLGAPVHRVWATVRGDLGSRARVNANPYPAVGLDWQRPDQFLNALGAFTRIARVGAYHDSVVEGKRWLRSKVESTVSACGDQTWIVLVGYSQGAQVSADVFQALTVTARRRVGALVLFADPYFNPSSPGAMGGFHDDHFGLLGIRPRFARTDAARSYCHRRDPICQGSQGNLAVPRFALGTLSFAAHSNYDELDAESAGRWILTRLASLPGPSVTRPPVTAPPTADPPVGDPSVDEPPVPAASPRLAIFGSCTSSGGALTSSSSGFSPGGTATIRAWYPNGSPYTNLISVSRVRSDGSIAWGWPCAGDPGGTYSTEAIDDATGASTGRVSFTIGAPQPPPPPALVTLTVFNMVTNGPTQMREDTPAYLSTRPENFCRSRGCVVPGTDRNTGGTFLPAVCQTQGPRTTNGHDASPSDDANPGLFSSTRWYGVRLAGGGIGFISEVWIDPGQRGGIGLPSC